MDGQGYTIQFNLAHDRKGKSQIPAYHGWDTPPQSTVDVSTTSGTTTNTNQPKRREERRTEAAGIINGTNDIPPISSQSQGVNNGRGNMNGPIRVPYGRGAPPPLITSEDEKVYGNGHLPQQRTPNRYEQEMRNPNYGVGSSAVVPNSHRVLDKQQPQQQRQLPPPQPYQMPTRKNYKNPVVMPQHGNGDGIPGPTIPGFGDWNKNGGSDPNYSVIFNTHRLSRREVAPNRPIQPQFNDQLQQFDPTAYAGGGGGNRGAMVPVSNAGKRVKPKGCVIL